MSCFGRLTQRSPRPAQAWTRPARAGDHGRRDDRPASRYSPDPHLHANGEADGSCAAHARAQAAIDLRMTYQTTERGDLCCAHNVHGLGDHSAPPAPAPNARARGQRGLSTSSAASVTSLATGTPAYDPVAALSATVAMANRRSARRCARVISPNGTGRFLRAGRARVASTRCRRRRPWGPCGGAEPAGPVSPGCARIALLALRPCTAGRGGNIAGGCAMDRP